MRQLLSVGCVVLATLMMLPAQEATKGKKRALLVGVKTYSDDRLRNLDFTENDVNELSKELEKGGFEITLLTTTSGEKDKSKQPSAKNIRAALSKVLDGVGKGDLVLVALSGHGLHFEVQDKDKTREESFFCPCDARPKREATLEENSKSLIGYTELFRVLDDSGGGAKLLLIDACRDRPTGFKSAGADTIPNPPRGLAALFSCSPDQKSEEKEGLGGLGHGVFFYSVLKGLRGKAKNADGKVTWGTLVEYVAADVESESIRLVGEGHKQTPEQKTSLRGSSPVLLSASDVAKESVSKEKPWSKEFTNSIGMKFVQIPKGDFMMGADKTVEVSTLDNEKPRRKITISKDFWLGVHEVTQKQYETLLTTNPSHFSSGGGGKDKVKDIDTSDFPVEQVSWQDAQTFIKKLNESTKEIDAGRTYFLPSEAQWEYACRGSSTASASYHLYHFGNYISSADANYYETGLERTCKVGSYKANAFELYDMHGNVHEWCADWFAWYPEKEETDPSGPAKGTNRVFRGGCWSANGLSCRSAARGAFVPTSNAITIGFRVAAIPSR